MKTKNNNSLLFMKFFSGLTISLVIGYFFITMFAQHDDNHKHHATSHIHKSLAVSPDIPTPSIIVDITEDTKSGYNVSIQTENFRFTPEAVNTEPIQGEGHAHIYVNDHKVARVYGNWFHLPAELFVAGENTITVTLNANDHSDWLKNDTVISDSIVVTK